MKRTLLAIISACCAAVCAFFCWYTVRLIWVNLAVPDAARHRQSGMFIGAVVFPAAALLFGYVGWRCLSLARRARR